jgi:hypothetical protein
MSEHVFGGEWTREKLERVSKYLQAYTTIFMLTSEQDISRHTSLMLLQGPVIGRTRISLSYLKLHC